MTAARWWFRPLQLLLRPRPAQSRRLAGPAAQSTRARTSATPCPTSMERGAVSEPVPLERSGGDACVPVRLKNARGIEHSTQPDLFKGWRSFVEACRAPERRAHPLHARRTPPAPRPPAPAASLPHACATIPIPCGDSAAPENGRRCACRHTRPTQCCAASTPGSIEMTGSPRTEAATVVACIPPKPRPYPETVVAEGA